MTTDRDPLIGDEVLRVAREAEIATVDIEVPRRTISVRGIASPMVLVYSFVAVALIGAVLLMLPISNADAKVANPVTALFTASSAVTVTGLVLTDTDVAWTVFGQAVIMTLIFIGGLGFMTGAAFMIILLGQRLGLQNRLIVREGLGGGQLGDVVDMVRRLVIFSVGIQIVAFIVFAVYWLTVQRLWEGIGTVETIWYSLFHAVSAFNNAGFDIMPDAKVGGASLVGLKSDFVTPFVTALIVFIGAFGYIASSDIWRTKRFARFTLDTKLVIVGVVGITLFGITTYLIGEWSNPYTSGNAGVAEKFSDAFFHAMAGRTAGFAVIDYANTLGTTDISTEVMMFIGGVSGSVAGGIKINTFMVLLFAVALTLAGRDTVNAFGRQFPGSMVRRTLVVGLISISSVIALVFALVEAQNQIPFRDALFETMSAFGTVGLSTGLTPELNTASRLIIVLAMFLGRFGPLSLGLLMAGRLAEYRYSLPTEEVRIG